MQLLLPVSRHVDETRPAVKQSALYTRLLTVLVCAASQLRTFRVLQYENLTNILGIKERDKWLVHESTHLFLVLLRQLWAGCALRIWQKKYECKYFVGNLLGNVHVEHLEADGRVT